MNSWRVIVNETATGYSIYNGTKGIGAFQCYAKNNILNLPFNLRYHRLKKQAYNKIQKIKKSFYADNLQ